MAKVEGSNPFVRFFTQKHRQKLTKHALASRHDRLRVLDLGRPRVE